MEKKLNIKEQLKDKYYKVDEIDNFKELLNRSSLLYKNNDLFKLKNENGQIYSVTYEEFINDVSYLGTSLINRGLLGKRIAVIGKNSYNWSVSYLAASIVGVVVPIDKELHNDDIINFLNSSYSKCILGDEKNLVFVKEKKNNLINKDTIFISFEKSDDDNSFNSLLEHGKQLYLNGSKDFDNIQIDPDELKILLFTSGTTGSAKGVCLSQKNICSNIVSTCSIVKATSKDTFFSVLPLHHTYECTLGFLLPIYCGSSIVHCEGLKYIAQNMKEFHPSVILSVPLLLEKLNKNIIKGMNSSLPKKYQKIDENPFPSLPWFLKGIVKNKVKKNLGGKLRLFIVGAASVTPYIIKEFSELGLTTLQGYGLTECSPLVAGNTDFFSKDDAVGLPIPNVEYMIDSPNNEGIGEIIVKGPNIMLGYYNDDEKTNSTIIDGWFHTGDLGKIDDNGYLYITGRCKSVIITKNGKNVYPEELEQHLNNMPFVSESLVLGFHENKDDDIYVTAQIYPNWDSIKEYFKGIIPSKEKISSLISNAVAEVNKKLPNYKHIKKFVIRDKEFDKTTTQKVKRYGDNTKF